LARTVKRADVDLVVSGTPNDLGARIAIDTPTVRARHAPTEVKQPGLGESVDAFPHGHGLI
jgi:predicted GTPase